MDRRAKLQQWMAAHERGPAWVARKTGYTREWISAVLHGQKPFSDKLARALTEILGITFEEPAMSERLADVVEFADNPEPRCPCVLLLDTSASMQGRPIAALNQGLHTFRDALSQDELAARRVEVAIVTFDSQVQVVQDFVTADQFQPPTLTAQGLTHMGTAILQALDMLQARKAQYRTHGVAYYRPWVFMMTDGQPQGEDEQVVTRAAQRIKEDEDHKRVAFFAVGVENPNMTRLRQIVVRTPLKHVGLDFTQMFCWLSTSIEQVSQSRPDEQVGLTPPVGWAVV